MGSGQPLLSVSLKVTEMKNNVWSFHSTKWIRISVEIADPFFGVQMLFLLYTDGGTVMRMLFQCLW